MFINEKICSFQIPVYYSSPVQNNYIMRKFLIELFLMKISINFDLLNQSQNQTRWHRIHPWTAIIGAVWQCSRISTTGHESEVHEKAIHGKSIHKFWHCKHNGALTCVKSPFLSQHLLKLWLMQRCLGQTSDSPIHHVHCRPQTENKEKAQSEPIQNVKRVQKPEVAFLIFMFSNMT